jgi:hypothetical protein
MLAVMVVVLAVGTTFVGGIPSAAGATQPAGLDHFLCYDASIPAGVPGFLQVPVRVRLKNQFAPAPFPVKVNPVPNLHCNPTVKIVPTATGALKTYPITHPKAHLLCFPITAPKQPTPLVLVRNQFGKATLQVGQPSSLCLPTWKNLAAPPPQVQPPGLDHFTCYPVTYAPGTKTTFHPPAGVQLQDQFSPAGPVPVQVLDPSMLCLPTTKIVGSTKFPPARPNAHLMCFNVTPTPFPPSVLDQNQFGASPVNINATRFLCLPSFKTIVTTP